MPHCVAVGCNSQSRNKNKLKNQPDHSKGVSFFVFPKNENRRAAWIRAVRRKDWLPGKDSRLCSKHFSEDQINRTLPSGPRLKDDAVPNIFSYNQDAILPRRKTINGRKQLEQNPQKLLQDDDSPGESVTLTIKAQAGPSSPSTNSSYSQRVLAEKVADLMKTKLLEHDDFSRKFDEPGAIVMEVRIPSRPTNSESPTEIPTYSTGDQYIIFDVKVDDVKKMELPNDDSLGSGNDPVAITIRAEPVYSSASTKSVLPTTVRDYQSLHAEKVTDLENLILSENDDSNGIDNETSAIATEATAGSSSPNANSLVPTKPTCFNKQCQLTEKKMADLLKELVKKDELLKAKRRIIKTLRQQRARSDVRISNLTSMLDDLKEETLAQERLALRKERPKKSKTLILYVD